MVVGSMCWCQPANPRKVFRRFPKLSPVSAIGGLLSVVGLRLSKGSQMVTQWQAITDGHRVADNRRWRHRVASCRRLPHRHRRTRHHHTMMLRVHDDMFFHMIRYHFLPRSAGYSKRQKDRTSTVQVPNSHGWLLAALICFVCRQSFPA